LRLVPALLVALAFVLQAAFAQPASAEAGVPCPQTGIETVASDQAEYAPGSIVHITGTGYGPGCDVVMKVTRPDGSVVRGDGSFEPGSDTVTTDLLGELSYDYQLQSVPAVPGVYAVDVLGVGDAVLAQMTFADAFGVSRLRLGSAAGAENYIYTVGDVIYPEGDVDNSKWYRFEVRDASNVLRSSFACTPTSSFSTTNNTYTVQSSDPVSTSADYTFRLTQYNNNTCSSVDKTASQAFEVAKATVYSNALLTTQRSSFTTGETAYVVVAGVQQSKNNYDTRWIKPDSTTSCENTGGNDRPDTNANGVVPGTAGGFLQYRPNTTPTGDDWNRESNYDAPCAAFAGTNQGTWKLRLQMDAKHFVTLTVFSVDTTAPTATIDQASTQADPTVVSPIHFTAVFNEPVSGFSGADVSFSSSTAGGTKVATVTEISPNNGTTYDVSVSGMTSRGTVVATIPAGGAQDGAGNGNTASTSTDNTVGWDRVPTATVSLNDHSPRTNDILTATATKNDPDGDAVSLTFVWKVNGVTKRTFSSSSALSDTFDLSVAGNGSKGDAVTVDVTPNDGLFDGTAAADSATIVNSAPSATVSLNDHSPRTNDTLTATATKADADVDAVSLTFVWKVNGATKRTFSSPSALSDTFDLSIAGNGSKGDAVTVEVTPNDGSVNGTAATDLATVANTAPTVTLDGLTSADEGATNSYTFTTHDDDSEALSFAGGYPTCGTGGELQGSPVIGDGSFDCKFPDGPAGPVVAIKVSDGTDSSNEATKSVSVANVEPTVTLTGADSADEGQTKSYSYTTSDPGDEVFSRDAQSCGANGTLSNPSFDSSDGSGSFDCSFPDGHAFSTVSVTIGDGDSGADSDSITVEIANVAPSATLANDGPVDEGSAATISFADQFDPSGPDTAAGFHYAYSCSNGSLSGATYAGSGSDESTQCTFEDGPSDHTVRARIIDRDGGFSEYTTSVHVANVDPTATLANNGPVDEGSPATISFADQFDPSSADTAAGFHYAYSCSNDDLSGATYAGSGSDESTQCTFEDGPSDHTVKARIIDRDGGFSEYTTSVHVVNVAPSVTIDGPSPVDEGTTHTYTFSVSDPGDDGFTVDDGYPRCGLNGTYVDDSLETDADGGSFQCFFADGPATTSVAIKVVDSDGASDTDSEAVQVVQVDNVAPTADLGNDGPVDEGSPATIGFSNQFDPSSADTAAGFHYAYSCSNDDLTGATYANTARSSASASCSYDDGPSDHTVKARIIDQNDGYSQYTTSVHVRNVAPTATLSNNGPVDEGSAATISFADQFDPSSADTAAGFHYEYRCDGSAFGAVDYDSAGTSASHQCSFDDGPSTHTVRARIIDKDNGFSEYTTGVQVANVAPSATLSNNGPVDEGSPATISFSNQLDPSSADTAAGFHYAYSCSNSDLSGATYAGSGTSASTTCSYSDGPSNHTVRGRIIDRDGGFSEYTTVVHVNDATRPHVSIDQAAGQADPTSASPIHFTAVFSEPVSGFDGSDVTVGGSADPSTALVTDSGDHMTYDVAVSGMSSDGTVTASISVGRASDPAGNTNTISTSTDNQVTYDASRPQVSINQAAGQDDPTSTSPIRFTAVFNEPVSDFGNGDVTIGGTAGGSKSASVSNPSNDHMTYDVAVSGMTTSGTVTASIAGDRAHDATGNGNYASTSTDNTVTWQESTTNAAPVVTITQPTFGQLYAKPATVNLSASFTDADTTDTHTCSINWDDGGTTGGTVSESGGSGTCIAQHTYNSAGVYTIVVSLSDNRGGSGTAEVMVVVYDASAGFVTGGGWITVQQGSYPAQPNLSGRANFGFNSQYRRGQNVPNGETEFQFEVGNFNFHSTTYTWLVVSGYKAQFRGTGTVNGATGYNFLLTGYDGQVRGNGNTGVDRFRIKVTRNGETVFDNRMGSSEDLDSANPQNLGGGSIVIHSA